MRTADAIPDLSGKVMIVTGANSGLGLESTLALARKGAQVIMACRSPQRGQNAYQQVQAMLPNAEVVLAPLDLGSLASIRSFAAWFQSEYGRLDLLLNNAGVMGIPHAVTEDGFEMQLGVNHLGHFALTGYLLPLLLATPPSRVVNVTSLAYMMARINFADLMSEGRYNPSDAYGQSKLANLLHTLELQNRLAAAGAATIAVSAHPGYALTNLQNGYRGLSKARQDLQLWAMITLGDHLFAQGAAMGVLPQLYAATAPGVKGGDFYGPRRLVRGYPRLIYARSHAYDGAAAAQLWDRSVALTGVEYTALAPFTAGAVSGA